MAEEKDTNWQPIGHQREPNVQATINGASCVITHYEDEDDGGWAGKVEFPQQGGQEARGVRLTATFST